MLGGWPRRGYRTAYLLVFLSVTVVSLVLLSNSEPYEFSRKYVASDPKVVQLTGLQSSTRVSWLRGFRYAFGDRTGEAYFTFDVKGDHGRFEIRVWLEKRNGVWTAVSTQAVSENGLTHQVLGAER